MDAVFFPRNCPEVMARDRHSVSQSFTGELATNAVSLNADFAQRRF